MSIENFDEYCIKMYENEKDNLKTDDYLEYLVNKVWKIDKAVDLVDFGCGYGRMGYKLLPLLPKGSTYTGFDISEKLINTAKKIFEDLPYKATFKVGNVKNAPCEKDSFDISFSYTVLMHIQDPLKALEEMKRVTKNDGRMIICEATRMAYSTLIYSAEFEKYEYSLDMLKKYFKSQRDELNLDYNIGMKIPVMMSKLGLRNIGAKFHNEIDCLLQTNSEAENKKVYERILSQDYGEVITDEMRKKYKAIYIRRGASEEEAEDRISKEMNIAEDFRTNGMDFNIVFPSTFTWSYGTIEK